jgi:energy-coupling factor transporter ATP-binding protein EcfA2
LARVVDEPDVAVVEWSTFRDFFQRAHKQGEHVAIVGPTGSGKSVLGLELCQVIGERTASDRRPARVVVFAYKPHDATISRLGWKRISPSEWPPGYGQEHVVLWPKYGSPETAATRQRQVFRRALLDTFSSGGTTVYIDEVAYFEERPPDGLGLRPIIKQCWTAGRSNHLTIIAGTQRPRDVARSMWSEPSWLFAFRVEDVDDLKRVGEIGGARELALINDRLGGHEFVCVRRQRGGVRELYVSRVE